MVKRLWVQMWWKSFSKYKGTLLIFPWLYCIAETFPQNVHVKLLALKIVLEFLVCFLRSFILNATCHYFIYKYNKTNKCIQNYLCNKTNRKTRLPSGCVQHTLKIIQTFFQLQHYFMLKVNFHRLFSFKLFDDFNFWISITNKCLLLHWPFTTVMQIEK